MMKTVAYLLLLFSCLWFCTAEIFEFDHFDVAPGKTLTPISVFYVYANDQIDAVPAELVPDDSATAKKKKHATVTFGDMRFTNSQRSNAAVEIVLYHAEDFRNDVTRDRFCCTARNEEEGCHAPMTLQKKLGSAHATGHLDPDTATGETTHHDEQKLKKTGPYILWVSHCDDAKGLSFSGTVMVKSIYGYLPGDMYPKLGFYGWLALAYLALAAVWLVLSFVHMRELTLIQNWISACLVLGLFESLTWYSLYVHWNSTGKRPIVFLGIALVFSVTKNAAAFFLVLLAVLGLGIIRPTLDPVTWKKAQALFGAYIIAHTAWEMATHFFHDKALSFFSVLFVLLPASIVNALIFFWIFTALDTLLERLEERKQTEKLRVFRFLFWILAASVGVACLAVVALFYVTRMPHQETWKYMWLFTDGLFESIFWCVLVAICLLWIPNKHAQLYVYSAVAKIDIEGLGATTIGKSAQAADKDGDGGAETGRTLADSATGGGDGQVGEHSSRGAVRQMGEVEAWREELDLDDDDNDDDDFSSGPGGSRGGAVNAHKTA
uniref:GOST seven transmembrane domain-containing protein n=1 Tax=Chromera velia CCMP2878 TaxID=1169474 RepID=A0A0G4G9G7_9ALVE|eukprot:Cvel_20850.t1-p1 / transcript=Cvel_20850.t1 / gene=Cvel_20850 / organism=Chromera_velia_CCMP2878 / gene_product=Transmembrane protein 87A, putative / transcript_product=Transmembrane protein 87A, putative / location=Cvel_scaffold1910:8072-14538(+) / protein_length=548 / sequence_SO=supercontig / SO=protein_coding / is_pseudo=false